MHAFLTTALLQSPSRTPLSHVAEGGRIARIAYVKLLLSLDSVNPDAKDNNGCVTLRLLIRAICQSGPRIPNRSIFRYRG